MPKESDHQPTEATPLQPHIDVFMKGVEYPQNGQWPELFTNFEDLANQFPWAHAVVAEIKLLYARELELRPDIHKPPTDQVAYDLVLARLNGTMSALRCLGLKHINGQAKDELKAK